MVTESTRRQASTSRGCLARAATRVGRSLAAIVLLSALTVGAAARADDPPAHPPLGIFIYAISRDGSPVGQRRMEFVSDGEKLRVISHTEIKVTLLGMSLFSYEQQAEEVRSDGKITSFTADADDDGKDKKIDLALEGDRLKGQYNSKTPRDLDPRLETSLFWQKPATGDIQVIDHERGKLRDIRVTEIGPETLNLPLGKIETRHYRVTGEIKRDLWYDTNAVLVAGEQQGPDGSIVRMELQQRP
jgi:hypothetical protein